MTIAIDKVSGAVVGQIVFQMPPLADQYAPAGMREPAPLRLLTGNGYVNVDAVSVRLERVEDN